MFHHFNIEYSNNHFKITSYFDKSILKELKYKFIYFDLTLEVFLFSCRKFTTVLKLGRDIINIKSAIDVDLL